MYLPHINGLRAIAVSSVILFHLSIESFEGGFVGVDIFFVISGYLITLQLAENSSNSGLYSILDFYKRRVIRIFPPLLAVVLVTIATATILFTPTDLYRLSISAASSVFGLSNFFFWNEAGYFDTSSINKPLLHTWSLSIELQFYLLYPIIFFSIQNFSKKIILSILIFLTTLSMPLINIFEDGFTYFKFLGNSFSNGPETIFYLLPFRMFEFFIGSITYFAQNYGPKKNIDIISYAGFVILFTSITQIDSTYTFPSFITFLPCLGTSLVIYGNKGWIYKNILCSRIMNYVGKVSYSLYLAHWPIIVFYNYSTPTDLTTTDNIIIVTLIIILSLILYYTVESRHTARKTHSSKTHPFRFITIIAALSLAVSCLIVVGDGWEWRIDNPIQTVSTESFNKHLPCDLNEIGNICDFGSGASPTTIWIGDSLMEHYLPIVNTHYNGRKKAFVRGGCLIMPIASRKHENGLDNKCEKLKDHALTFLKENRELTVILSQYWNGYFDNNKDLLILENGDEYSASYKSKKDILKASINSLKTIAEKNNHIIIIINNTIFNDFDREIKCRNTPINRCPQLNTNIPIEQLKKHRILNEDIITNTKSKNIKYFDPLNNFCNNNGTCNLILDNKELLLRDHIHYTLRGSEIALQGLKELVYP